MSRWTWSPATPASRPAFDGRVFNVNDYGGAAGRNALWADLAQREYIVAGIICAAEPIMTKWKWWLAAKASREDFHHQRERRLFLAGSRAPRASCGRFVRYRLGLTRIGRGARAGAAGVFSADARLSVVVRWHGTPAKETTTTMKAVFIEQTGGIDALQLRRFPHAPARTRRSAGEDRLLRRELYRYLSPQRFVQASAARGDRIGSLRNGGEAGRRRHRIQARRPRRLHDGARLLCRVSRRSRGAAGEDPRQRG